jgi:putative tryptophan/tyrosine transport system substrate-binding protein
MRRREFITLLGITAVARLRTASAQQSTKRLIGVLSNPSGDRFEAVFPAFHRGLRESGYVDGQNVAIEYRFADGKTDRLPALAADLVNRNIAALVAFTGARRKGGNYDYSDCLYHRRRPGEVRSGRQPQPIITGITFFSTQMEAKRLGLLHELIPDAKLIAVLINPSQPAAAAQGDEVAAAARALGLRVFIVYASSWGELDNAVAACVQMGAGGLVVTADALFFNRQKEIVTLAARHAIPAIYEWRDFVLAGGLASYGSSITDALHQAGIYTGEILGGAKVTDLPVVQTTKFEFVINLRTAKALGIDVPPMLSARADDVIE